LSGFENRVGDETVRSLRLGGGFELRVGLREIVGEAPKVRVTFQHAQTDGGIGAKSEEPCHSAAHEFETLGFVRVGDAHLGGERSGGSGGTFQDEERIAGDESQVAQLRE
jgi:hypothetical protein